MEMLASLHVNAVSVNVKAVWTAQVVFWEQQDNLHCNKALLFENQMSLHLARNTIANGQVF